MKKGDFLRILQWRDYLLWRLLSSISNNPFVARLSVFSGWRIRVLDWGLGGADKIAVMGDFYKRLFVCRGIPSSKILVTGYPLLDEVPDKTSAFDKVSIYEKLNLKSNKKLAVLITQPFVEDGYWSSAAREKLIKSIIEVSECLDIVQFVIKLHPRESVYEYEKIVGNRMYLFKEIDLHELLLASDVVLTVSSTVGLWALAYKKPLIILDYLSSGSDILYKDVAIVVNDSKDLPTVITNAISDSNNKTSLFSKNEQFLRDHIWRLDGKASSRIAELIYLMVSQAESTFTAQRIAEKNFASTILLKANA
jgi:UDP-N-acetylglucosamine 2-epimerase